MSRATFFNDFVKNPHGPRHLICGVLIHSPRIPDCLTEVSVDTLKCPIGKQTKLEVTPKSFNVVDIQRCIGSYPRVNHNPNYVPVGWIRSSIRRNETRKLQFELINLDSGAHLIQRRLWQHLRGRYSDT